MCPQHSLSCCCSLAQVLAAAALRGCSAELWGQVACPGCVLLWNWSGTRTCSPWWEYHGSTTLPKASSKGSSGPSPSAAELLSWLLPAGVPVPLSGLVPTWISIPGLFARALRESVLDVAVLFSSPSLWGAALPKVFGRCKLGNAVGSCPRHPEPPREWERDWRLGLQIHSQLILVNTAANCGLAESGGGAPAALPEPAWSLFLVPGRFHRGAREEILL